MTPPSHKIRKGSLFHQTSYSTEGRFVKWADKHLKRTTELFTHTGFSLPSSPHPLPVPGCDACRSQEIKVPRRSSKNTRGSGRQVNLVQAWEAAVPNNGSGTTGSFSDSVTMCRYQGQTGQVHNMWERMKGPTPTACEISAGGQVRTRRDKHQPVISIPRARPGRAVLTFTPAPARPQTLSHCPGQNHLGI